MDRELKERVERAVNCADIAFWGVIANHFPEAREGDFSPDQSMDLEKAMHKAVSSWLRNNTDLVEDQDD